jgi:hypothetical protein
MAQKGQEVPPQVLIELSPLTGSVKKKVLDMIQQAQNAPPNPLQVAGAEAELRKVNSEAMRNEAMAQKALADAGTAGMNGEAGPSEMDLAQALADIRNKNASTEKTMAETAKITVETQLKPIEMENQQIEQERGREERFVMHKDQMRQASDGSRRP